MTLKSMPMILIKSMINKYFNKKVKNIGNRCFGVFLYGFATLE